MNEASLTYGTQRSSIREITAQAGRRAAELGADKVFDFSLGNPSMPIPQEIHEALLRQLARPSQEVHGYSPNAGLPSTRQAVAEALCKRFGVGTATADDLFMTCAAAASLTTALHAIVTPGDEVLVISPYFPEYKVWIEAAGGVCVEVPADPETFDLDLEAIAAHTTHRTRALIINSPNNPVGVVYSRKHLQALADMLRRLESELSSDLYLISDEPYREIAYGVEVPWVPALYPRTLVCYSYSKSFSLAGERIGWVLVPPQCPCHDEVYAALSGAARKLGFVCAPTLFQQVLAECADVLPSYEVYEQNRDKLLGHLRSLGYEVIEPEGAFYLWLKAPTGDDEEFCTTAMDYELYLVPSMPFGCRGWARIGYCVDPQVVEASLSAWSRFAERYRVL